MPVGLSSTKRNHLSDLHSIKMVPFRLKRCRGTNCKMATDWSNLLPEILNSIAREIYVYEDLQAFLGVCTSWRSAVREDKTFIPPLVSRFPSLLLAESKVKEEQEYRQLFLLSGGMGKLHLPEACNQRIVSSHGWLMTAAEDEIQAKLIHPYSRVQIDLPKLSTFPDYSFYGLLFNNTIRKVVLTSSDPLDPFFRVIVLHGGRHRLGICKPGDDSWTTIESGLEGGGFLYDIIYHYGRKRLYGVGRMGAIFEGDIYGSGSGPVVMRKLSDNNRILQPRYEGPYLVEWDDDSLLIVTRLFKVDDEEEEEEEEEDDDEEEEDDDDDEDVDEEGDGIVEEDEDEDVEGEDENMFDDEILKDNYSTFGFFVHQFSPKDGKITELDDLGGRALFLGYNSSIAIHASNDGTVRGNCIYFTDDCYDGYAGVGGGGGEDMGIYDYVNDTVEPLSDQLQESQSLVSPPLWLASSIN